MILSCIALASMVGSVRAAPQMNSPVSGPEIPPGGPGGDWSAFPIIPEYYTKVRVAHAALASVAWLVFFPLGAILIRTLETGCDYRDVKIHAVVQMIGYFMFAAAAGLGIWMAKTIDVLGTYHPIIGMTLLGCLAIQPMTELLNARFYQKFPKVLILAHLHIWFGRLIIIVGIIQGGLGFVLSGSFPMAVADPAPRIAYGVAAIIVWILYVSFAIVWPQVKVTFGWWRRKHDIGMEEGEGLRNRSLADLAAPSAIDRSDDSWR